jgi:RNA polymerase sigma factor (sigma-70 family)
MLREDAYGSADEIHCTAEWLLDQVEEVRGVLRYRGFSEHAIEQAVTVVYFAAMPRIKGTRLCLIENWRAWVFRVARNAAGRASSREVRCRRLEPAILAALVSDPGPDEDEEMFDIRDVLNQLTELQSEAVELCWLADMSQRDAAKRLGISVGTLGRHLKAAKKRLEEILAAFDTRSG